MNGNSDRGGRDLGGNSIPGSGKSMRKGPEAEACLVFWGNNKVSKMEVKRPIETGASHIFTGN